MVKMQGSGRDKSKKIGRNSAAYSAKTPQPSNTFPNSPTPRILSHNAPIHSSLGSRRNVFFTVTLLDRQRQLLTQEIDLLRSVFKTVQTKRPFVMDAVVVLPDHLHCIWMLPPDDADFSTRWFLIKSAFSKGIASGERLSDRRQKTGERGIWQRRFWEHTIRDEQDFARHVEYIHYNPVKHGYVQQVKEWPHSSFHRFVRQGIIPADWAAELGMRDVEWE